MQSPFTSIPLELMEILNKINDNVNDVKERVTRIEAQNHSASFQRLEEKLDKEQEKRIALEQEVSNFKTRLLPVTAGLSILGAFIIDYITKSI